MENKYIPLSTDTSKNIYIPAQHWIRPQNQLPTKPKFLTAVLPHYQITQEFLSVSNKTRSDVVVVAAESFGFDLCCIGQQKSKSGRKNTTLWSSCRDKHCDWHVKKEIETVVWLLCRERERETVGVLLCSFGESDGDGIGRGSLA